ncbi:unnamed protein product, partial [marine sediment metagenome]
VERMVKKSPVRLHFSFNKGMIIRFSPPMDTKGQLTGAKKVLQAIAI